MSAKSNLKGKSRNPFWHWNYLPLILAGWLGGVNQSAAQVDSTFNFRADLSVTNNGFSIIPAFTLGKPAAFLDMQMGNKRWSFAPQFRYSLEGRPWSFIFIYRYRAVLRPKFSLSVGGHLPGLNYITQSVTINGITDNLSVARRFLALEIIPTYKFSNKVSLGLYFLRGHGFQKSGPQNSEFISLQLNCTRIPVVGKAYVSFNPQLFYLKIDNSDGFYINATTTVGVRDFPIAVAGIVNQSLKSTIAAKPFDWNLSLIYMFERKFRKL